MQREYREAEAALQQQLETARAQLTEQAKCAEDLSVECGRLELSLSESKTQECERLLHAQVGARHCKHLELGPVLHTSNLGT